MKYQHSQYQHSLEGGLFVDITPVGNIKLIEEQDRGPEHMIMMTTKQFEKLYHIYFEHLANEANRASGKTK